MLPRRISRMKTSEKQTEKLQTFKEQQQKQTYLLLIAFGSLLALPFQIQQLSP